MISAQTTKDQLGAAVRAWQGRRVVLVGDLMLDTYIYGDTQRVSREAPVLVVRKRRREDRLGGAANTAANLASLGLQTVVLGTVGDDTGGRVLRRMLGDVGGIDVSGVRTVERTTAVKTRVLAGAIGTSKQQVLRLDDEPDDALPLAVAEAIAAELRTQARTADVVVVSDYGMHTLGEPVIAAVRDIAAQGAQVCVDSRYQLRAFAGVTAVTPNLPEAEAAVGRTITTPEDVQRAGRALRAELGCEACLLTQGRHGMTLFSASGASHVDIMGPDEVTDVTGAGDTVLATFSAALAGSLGMENGMRLSNCAAGWAVTRMGCAVISSEALLEQGVRHGLELLPWDR